MSNLVRNVPFLKLVFVVSGSLAWPSASPPLPIKATQKILRWEIYFLEVPSALDGPRLLSLSSIGADPANFLR